MHLHRFFYIDNVAADMLSHANSKVSSLFNSFFYIEAENSIYGNLLDHRQFLFYGHTLIVLDCKCYLLEGYKLLFFKAMYKLLVAW